MSHNQKIIGYIMSCVMFYMLGMFVCKFINTYTKQEKPEEVHTEIKMKEYASNDGVHWGFKDDK